MRPPDPELLWLDEGRLWAGTDGGLNLLENGRFKVYTTEQGPPNNRVYSIYQDQSGTLWIGTS